MKKVSVLFVCLGNICQSPTAHGVFQNLVDARGWSDKISVDSAGLGDWHAGEAPDHRARQEARRRGVVLEHLRARQVRASDFEEFDYILAMDRQNIRGLESLCPREARSRIRLFLEFAPASGLSEVPDPYYGGPDGFRLVYDLVEEASQGLLEDIEAKHLNA